jgi:hypothetical protein
VGSDDEDAALAAAADAAVAQAWASRGTRHDSFEDDLADEAEIELEFAAAAVPPVPDDGLAVANAHDLSPAVAVRSAAATGPAVVPSLVPLDLAAASICAPAALYHGTPLLYKQTAAQAATVLKGLVGDAAPPQPALESVFFWNAAGWNCGDVEVLPRLQHDAARRRYDVVSAVVASHDPPTYLLLTEMTGSLTDFLCARGLKRWLRSFGYDAALLPGPLNATLSAHLGGCLLAWKLADTEVDGHPCADSTSVALSGTFRHRSQPPNDPTTRIGVAYGCHRFHGKVKAVRAIALFASRSTSVLFAGDLNVTPSVAFQRTASSRTRGTADKEFAVLVGFAQSAAPAMAQLVPLGHNHAAGEFSHVDRANGQGTATIDHAVVTGTEQGQWTMSSRWLARSADGVLVSDHECIWLTRAPRVVITDGGGIYRLPRFHASVWSVRQRLCFWEAAAREFALLESGERASPTGGTARAGHGAALSDQLVAIINDAACEATAPLDQAAERRVARLGHAGGDLPGLRCQRKRFEGLLRKVRSAAAAVAHARTAAAAAAMSCSAGAAQALKRAVAHEEALYDPKSSSYVGRHNGTLRGVLQHARCCTGNAVNGLRSAVEARLQREVQYFCSKVAKLRRADDAAVWQGHKAAKDAADPEARRAAYTQAMRKPSSEGRKGVRGFLRGDGVWVGEAADVRRSIGDEFRRIDDDNYRGGSCVPRVLGFHDAFCPARSAELSGRSGGVWTLADECGLAEYEAALARLHADKATSLDRVSKELVELLPPEVRHACWRAAVAIGTPDEHGQRVHPAIWQKVPVRLLDKKTPSHEIEKLRDIGLPSQNLKLQGALYMPVYGALMPRLADVNHGWTPGIAARGAAMVGGLALDQALLLGHLLIGIYGDIKRMFPSMDRDVVMLSEMWYGLPRDVRDATRALYQNACMMYETEHGLPEFDFQTLHMTTAGAIQGCVLSTEKAKLFLNSLAEAFSVLAGGGGIRFWNGHNGGGRRETSTFCADDLLGMVTCWSGATAFVAVIDEWRAATASAFGIEGYSKTTYSAVMVDPYGVPAEAVAPDGLSLRIAGEPIPRLPCDAVYSHIGDRRRFDGEQDAELSQVTQLCHGWLKRMESMSRCSKREFAELTNGGFGAFIGAYAHCAPLTFKEGEAIEKTRRGLYRRRFRGHATQYNCDRYLPAAWQPEPRFGRVTQDIPEARMVGDGWHHATAVAAAFLHDAMTSALYDGIDSQLRRCARSGLDLLMFMWGMRGSHPAVWACDHLRSVLARRTGRGRSSRGSRIFPLEMFLLRFLEMRSLMNDTDMGRPEWNFTLEHVPDDDDPFYPTAPHHLPLDRDTLELFRGELVDPQRCQSVLGRQREPCWVLLRAGVVMRSHACTPDGSRFMSFHEAAIAIPDLECTPDARTDAAIAWKRLLADLAALQVKPVPGEPVMSAISIWRGGRPRGDGSDGAAVMGERDDLDGLLVRLRSGDVAAASEWAAAYRVLSNGRPPRAACERAMPAASAEERQGPCTLLHAG